MQKRLERLKWDWQRETPVCCCYCRTKSTSEMQLVHCVTRLREFSEMPNNPLYTKSRSYCKQFYYNLESSLRGSDCRWSLSSGDAEEDAEDSNKDCDQLMWSHQIRGECADDIIIPWQCRGEEEEAHLVVIVNKTSSSSWWSLRWIDDDQNNNSVHNNWNKNWRASELPKKAKKEFEEQK